MTNRAEFRVNTYTYSNQNDPKATALSDGGWVVTWESMWQDGSDKGVVSQAYDADGTPRGVETLVNTYTPDTQSLPLITGLADGGWVITWTSINQDGSSAGIYAQAFNADGTKQGAETQVNSYTANSQSTQQIAALTDGGWVITWQSFAQDGDDYGIYAQAYNADGTLQGVETQVNTFTTNAQRDPQITALADGGWVITWRSYQDSSTGYDIFAQAYNDEGTPQGGETQVNSSTTGWQDDPQITTLSDGGWVITWFTGSTIYSQVYNSNGTKQGSNTEVNPFNSYINTEAKIIALSDGGWVISWVSDGKDGSSEGIIAKAFNADGTTRGVEVVVNTSTSSAEEDHEIAALSDGGWVITWEASQHDGSSYGIFAQVFNADGTPLGGEIAVNTYTLNAQRNPDVVALEGGGFVITWQSGGQDGSSEGIYSRVFTAVSEADVSATVTGTQQEGETLTAEITGLDQTDATFAVTYYWIVDGEEVAVTSDATFVLTAEHVGKEISVLVDIADLVFVTNIQKISAETGPIDDLNSDPTGAVVIASDNADPATFDIGDTATAMTDTLADADVLGTLSYQWMLSGEVIVGATDATYVIGAGDKGQKLTVVVSYTDGAGYDEVITSQKVRIEGYTGVDLLGGGDADHLFGTNLEDRLKGGHGDDTLISSGGRDKLSGGHGNDLMIAGAGRDKLAGGRGDDTMFGGAGRDVFIFGARGDNDTIGDFEDGTDVMRIKGGASGFGDLTVAQVGADVRISYADTTITLTNTQAADIGADDFIF